MIIKGKKYCSNCQCTTEHQVDEGGDGDVGYREIKCLKCNVVQYYDEWGPFTAGSIDSIV